MSEEPLLLNKQMSQQPAFFKPLSTKPKSSKKANSSSRSDATKLATTPLTLMRLPPELRHRIYDFVWNEDITIELRSYAQPFLGGRYNKTRGRIRPQRLVYNSLQLVQRAKGGFRGDVQSITALRVCREFWNEGLSRGRFQLDGVLDDLQTFLWWKSAEPYFPLVRRLSLYHLARGADPYHQVSHRIHEAAEMFRNLRELDLSIVGKVYSSIHAIGKAVRGIVDCFPNKKPRLTVKVRDASEAPDVRVHAECFIHGLDAYTMTRFRDSEPLFREQSAKSFPQLRRVTVWGYAGECQRDVIQQYEYKEWGFDGNLVTARTGVGDASLWSDVFVRRLRAPIWVYTLKQR